MINATKYSYLTMLINNAASVCLTSLQSQKFRLHLLVCREAHYHLSNGAISGI